MASSRSEENVNIHYFTNWWCHSYGETCNFLDIFCKSNLADVIANVYYLYGRCCCHLCLILCHQSDVIDWWLVVMLPLLRFVWLILLPCGDVVTTCCVFVWLMLLTMLWLLLLPLVWFVADVVPLLLYHEIVCCWGTIVPVADVIATMIYSWLVLLPMADVIAKWLMLPPHLIYNVHWWLM